MTTVDGGFASRSAPARRAASPRAIAEIGRAAGAVAIFTAIMAVVIGFHAARTLPSFHSVNAILSALLDRLF